MKELPQTYYGYRYPAEIISHAVWLYHEFALSFRQVEERLAERRIVVTYETIRQWCEKFGPEFAAAPKPRRYRREDPWYLDVVVVSIAGERLYLWRATDKHDNLIDVFVQTKQNRTTAESFLRRC